jgi:hypothetical protein
MTNTPNLRSPEQVIGEIIDGILARTRSVNDVQKGSVLTQLAESFGRALFRSSADVISMIDASSVDRATGEALQRLAADRNVPILPALAATGKVSITDKSFSKISSVIYSGQPAAVAGSLTIYVTDASKMPSSGGSIYIGRGTLNSEGPLVYTSTTSLGNGTYWAINLSPTSPTTKFHNLGEVVVLSQGGSRVVQSGTSVQTAQGTSINSVNFATTSNATILDGETTVDNVPIVCTSPGTIGNVPRGAINQALGLPFQSTVFNPQPLSNGKHADSDEDIRTRIKAYEQAKAKGTEKAIQLASLGIVAPDELKKVASSSIVRRADGTSSLVFDDGSGYEPSFLGTALETVVDSALGGETELQLRLRPVVQSRVVSGNLSPYAVEDTSFLAVDIGGERTQHQFFTSEFQVPAAATAFEIVASINANPNLNFLANTFAGGTKVVLFPRNRNKNEIKVVAPTFGTNANDVFGFAALNANTIRLYKNDMPLFEDGIVAKVSTISNSSWNTAITSGNTLTYQVDGTVTVTIAVTDALFQTIDPLANVSSVADINIWAKAFNMLMPGVTATVNGDKIEFKSNNEAEDGSSIEILGGSLKDFIFASGERIFSEGRAPDFTLNKQTGQIGLYKSLGAGDKVTAGSKYTRANVLSDSIPAGPGAAGKLWVVVDGDSKIITNGFKSNTQVTFNKVGTKLTITANSPALVPEGFGNAQEGDWLIVYGTPTDNPLLTTNMGFWRLESAQVGQVVVDDGVVSRTNGTVTSILPDRVVLVRSSAPVQLFSFLANPLSDFVQSIRDGIVGVDAEIAGGSVRMSTQTYGSNGELLIAAADLGGKNLGFPVGEIIVNTQSHQGSVVTSDSEAGMPSFSHGTLSTMVNDQLFTEPNYLNLGGTENDFVEILEKYDTANNDIIAESNKSRRSLVRRFDTALNQLLMKVPAYMTGQGSLMQSADRYFLRSAYQFGSQDEISVIVDGDAQTKLFTAPVSRRISVSSNSTPTTQDFSADDAQSTLALNDPSSFNGFDFRDFKAWRQAHANLTNGTYSVNVKAFDFGPIGNTFRVGISYPTDINQVAMSHRILTDVATSIDLILPIETARTPNWDYTSSFTVSKTSSGNKDYITYTWRSGTEPDFSISGANVQVGDVAIISQSSDFLPGNKNLVGRISSVSATAFTIEVPSGASANDNVAFSTIVNYNGTVSITTVGNHNLTSGQRVGLWNTASPDGGASFPFNQSAVVTVTSPTAFTIPTPTGVPGGSISNLTHFNDTITVTTTLAHGLQPGNIVKISDVVYSVYDGYAPVASVLSANQFTIMKQGSSLPQVNIGRFDYQSYDVSTFTGITTISKTGQQVTVNTSAAHGLVAGEIAEVQSVVLDTWLDAPAYIPVQTWIPVPAWATATIYKVGDHVQDIGVSYRCITNHTSAASGVNGPPSTGTRWTADPKGTYAINDVVVYYVPWDETLGYTQDDYVQYHGDLWVCIVTHVATLTRPDANPTKWLKVTDAINWSGATAYVIGNFVKYNGIVYRAIAANTGFQPDTNPAKWTVAFDTAQQRYIALSLNTNADPTVSGAWATTSIGLYTTGQRVRFGTQNYIATALSHNINREPDLEPTFWTTTQVGEYSTGDLVRYAGQNYISLTVENANNPPSSSPAYWSVTALDLTGRFVVYDAPSTTQFRYYYPSSGSATGTSGTVSELKAIGRMARSLGPSTTSNLQIGLAQTTTQALVDYVTVNLADKLTASVESLPTDVINVSTADLDPTYISGSIINVTTLSASRKIQMTANVNIVAGASITVSGLVGPQAVYNGSYTVLASKQSGLNYILTLQSSVFSTTASSTVVAGTVIGTAGYRMLKDGDNSVYSTDLGALPASPMFTMKKAWQDAPEVGEEIRLIAVSADHVTRLWNRLAVTGLSNVSSVENSEYGRQIQLTTQTLGELGSIQVAGGSANRLSMAVVGSSRNVDDQVGLINVPYDIRQGLVPGQWIRLANQIRQNKNLQFDGATQLQLFTDHLEITGGPGTFQTQRVITSAANTEIKIEKHGRFTALIAVAGPSFGLIAAGVKEGDWVRIHNMDATAYSGATTYAIGNRVLFDGRNYTSLQNSNLNNQPDTSPTYWQIQEFSQSNEGIFKVVRTFGDNTFWIEHDNSVEDYMILGDASNLSFFSYDSVMPGDTLVITTNVLGINNVGRFTVADDTVFPILYFPTSTKIYFTQTATPTVGAVLMGNESSQVNVEEGDPLSVWKKIFALGPNNSTDLGIATDSPDLMNRFSSSLGSYIEAEGKLNFNEAINFGIDGYKFYVGLIKELNRIIYGDPADPIRYQGVRAAGTTIDIDAALIKRIKLGLSVRIKTGVPFSELRERIKAAVAGYVNNLGVGEAVSLSKVVAAANNIPGVVAVAVTYPTYDAANDVITTGAEQKAFVSDPTADIVVSVVGDA